MVKNPTNIVSKKAIVSKPGKKTEFSQPTRPKSFTSPFTWYPPSTTHAVMWLMASQLFSLLPLIASPKTERSKNLARSQVLINLFPITLKMNRFWFSLVGLDSGYYFAPYLSSSKLHHQPPRFWHFCCVLVPFVPFFAIMIDNRSDFHALDFTKLILNSLIRNSKLLTPNCATFSLFKFFFESIFF